MRCYAYLFVVINVFAVVVYSKAVVTKHQELEDNILRLEEEYLAPKNHARVARCLVHKAAWASFGTISTEQSIKGFPIVNIISVADSANNSKSTGNIYFYLTNLDFTGKDLVADNKLTVMFSDDQNLSCSSKGTDPMEPTCARVMFSGEAIQIPKDESEYDFAANLFLNRHPSATNWLRTHSFYLCKLNISNIFVLDFYGGPHEVTAVDYFAVDYDKNDTNVYCGNEG